MRTPSSRYPTDPEFPFELDPEPTSDTLTSYGGVPLLVRTCRSLVQEYYFRGDSACYEQQLLRWLADPARVGGPAGPIGFAVNAMMSEARRSAIQALPETTWQAYGADDPEVVRVCAEVAFVPEEGRANKDAWPLRYVAVRLRRRQGTLFADGTEVQYFAVVTNFEDWAAPRLLQWHREKAGTIEHVHHVLKNELGAGVLPCGRFGANAAWFRLAVRCERRTREGGGVGPRGRARSRTRRAGATGVGRGRHPVGPLIEPANSAVSSGPPPSRSPYRPIMGGRAAWMPPRHPAYTQQTRRETAVLALWSRMP